MEMSCETDIKNGNKSDMEVLMAQGTKKVKKIFRLSAQKSRNVHQTPGTEEHGTRSLWSNFPLQPSTLQGQHSSPFSIR